MKIKGGDQRMVPNPKAEPTQWRFFVHRLRRESDNLIDETAQLNIRRFRLMSLVTVPILLLFALIVGLREVETPDESRWQAGIVLFDLAMAAMYLLVNLAMAIMKGGKTLPWIQGVAATAILFFNVMLTVVGQLVSPNLTVLMVGLVSFSTIILFRPRTTAFVLFPNYLAFHFLLPLTQSNETLLFSNRINGLILFILAMFLSYLFWITKIQAVKQLGLIRDQRSQLEIANHRLYELATTDRLTELFNRGHMEELLSNKYAHLAQTDKQIVLLLLDIDNFKVVNDQLGHPVGDKLLQEIALLLKRHADESILLSRWGGDEFMIALLKSNEAKALEFASAILPEVRAIVCENEGRTVPVSASIGVAVVSDRFELAYQQVDRNLYQAKLQGKGRVVVGSSDILYK
jgi:diguanylate cyclase (GGDEF)-like protein